MSLACYLTDKIPKDHILFSLGQVRFISGTYFSHVGLRKSFSTHHSPSSGTLSSIFQYMGLSSNTSLSPRCNALDLISEISHPQTNPSIVLYSIKCSKLPSKRSSKSSQKQEIFDAKGLEEAFQDQLRLHLNKMCLDEPGYKVDE